ncbi:MAG: hypothetical protein AB7J28_04550 [Hyphomonadaceae bacterium]
MALTPEQLVWPVLIIAGVIVMAIWLVARGKRGRDGAPPQE